MSGSITLLYAALLALILMALSIRVAILRRRHRVGIGTGQVHDLKRAVRAHANFCEYVPLALILLFLLDTAAAVSDLTIHILGLSLLIGRILHALGLSRSAGTSMGRLVGSLLTWLMVLFCAFYGLWLGIGGS